MASRIRVCWVRVCGSWAVPSQNVGCFVKRETIIFVVDVIVISIVLKVCSISTYQHIPEIVWRSCPSHIRVKPVVNCVVVLVKRTKAIVVKILVVIKFAIHSRFTVSVSTWSFIWSSVCPCIIAKAIIVVIDVCTNVWNSVVVVIRVEHVEDAVVIVIGIR